MIEDLAKLIPESMLPLSGKAFYSGRAAFERQSPVYVLGLNPGGAPEAMQDETVGAHPRAVLRTLPHRWSAYADESWKGRAPGTSGLQPRVLHLAKRLGMEPWAMPASNLVFARSVREADFTGSMDDAAEAIWPFHRAATERLGARVVVCFGGAAGAWVQAKLGADQAAGDFVEANNRNWRSYAMRNAAGLAVATLTHPSIANWRDPRTDPTPLVLDLLAR